MTHNGILSALCVLCIVCVIEACDPLTYFTCTNQACIPKGRECDGIPDCPDWSDEYPGCVPCVPGVWSSWRKVSSKDNRQSCHFERTLPVSSAVRDCEDRHETVKCTTFKCSAKPCTSDADCLPLGFCGMHPSGKRSPTCCMRGALKCHIGNNRDCIHHFDCNMLQYCQWDKMNRHSKCCQISHDDIVCPNGPFQTVPFLCYGRFDCPPGGICTKSPSGPFSYCCPPPP